MNSEPLSESIPWRRKGSVWRIASRACCTRAAPGPGPPGSRPRWCGCPSDSGSARTPRRPIPAVRHQIDLGEAGDGDVPVVGPQRNVMLQQRSGLRAPVPPLGAAAWSPPAAGPSGGTQAAELSGTPGGSRKRGRAQGSQRGRSAFSRPTRDSRRPPRSRPAPGSPGSPYVGGRRRRRGRPGRGRAR